MIGEVGVPLGFLLRCLFPPVSGSPDHRDGVYMLLISKSEGGAILRDASRRGNVWLKEVTSASLSHPNSPGSFFFFAQTNNLLGNSFQQPEGQKEARCRCVEAIGQSLFKPHLKEELRGI